PPLIHNCARSRRTAIAPTDRCGVFAQALRPARIGERSDYYRTGGCPFRTCNAWPLKISELSIRNSRLTGHDNREQRSLAEGGGDRVRAFWIGVYAVDGHYRALVASCGC